MTQIKNKEVAFTYPAIDKVLIPQYWEFDPQFAQSPGAFFHKSRSVPISWVRSFKIPVESGMSINPGVGFAYFKNSVNQVVRKSPPSMSNIFTDYPI